MRHASMILTCQQLSRFIGDAVHADERLINCPLPESSAQSNASADTRHWVRRTPPPLKARRSSHMPQSNNKTGR